MPSRSSRAPRGRSFADLLAPPACVLCRGPGEHLCPRCASMLEEPPSSQGAADIAGVDSLVALCAYDGPGRDLVLAIKRGNRRGALGLFAASLASAVPEPSPGFPAGCVTWPPTTASRRRSRGFDQSELLARRVAGELGLECRRLLARSGGDLQGATRSERLYRVAFRARSMVVGHVVLVDDVVTTGATMGAAASALRDAGATGVTGVALARA